MPWFRKKKVQKIVDIELDDFGNYITFDDVKKELCNNNFVPMVETKSADTKRDMIKSGAYNDSHFYINRKTKKKIIVRISKHPTVPVVNRYRTFWGKIKTIPYQTALTKKYMDKAVRHYARRKPKKINEYNRTKRNWILANMLKLSPKLYYFNLVKTDLGLHTIIINEAYQSDLYRFYGGSKKMDKIKYKSVVDLQMYTNTDKEIQRQLITIFFILSTKLNIICHDIKPLNTVINWDIPKKGITLNNPVVKLIDLDGDWCNGYEKEMNKYITITLRKKGWTKPNVLKITPQTFVDSNYYENFSKLDIPSSKHNTTTIASKHDVQDDYYTHIQIKVSVVHGLLSIMIMACHMYLTVNKNIFYRFFQNNRVLINLLKPALSATFCASAYKKGLSDNNSQLFDNNYHMISEHYFTNEKPQTYHSCRGIFLPMFDICFLFKMPPKPEEKALPSLTPDHMIKTLILPSNNDATTNTINPINPINVEPINVEPTNDNKAPPKPPRRHKRNRKNKTISGGCRQRKKNRQTRRNLRAKMKHKTQRFNKPANRKKRFSRRKIK